MRTPKGKLKSQGISKKAELVFAFKKEIGQESMCQPM